MKEVIDATGKVVGQVVTGLANSPLMLGLMVLNALGIGAAVWFLSALAAAQQSRWDAIIKTCLTRAP